MSTKKAIELLKSSTAKSTYITSAADISLAVLTAVTTALIARSLSPSDFGTFISLWTFLTLIASVLDLGVGAGIIAFVAKTSEKNIQNKYIGSSLLFLFLAGGMQFLIISLWSDFWNSWLFPEAKVNLLILVALGGWLLILGRFAMDALRAKQNFIAAAVALIGFASLRLFLIIFAIWENAADLETIIFIMSLSPLFFVLIGYWQLKISWKHLSWSWQTAKQVISFSSWLGINQTVSTISGRVDVLILNRLSGATSAGIFGTASLMARIFAILSGSMSAVFAPRLIQLHEKRQKKKFLIKISLIVLVMWGGMFISGLIAKPAIYFIFGEKYLQAVQPFYWLLVAMAILTSTIPVTLTVIYILKKPHIIAILSFIQLGVIFAGNLLFIPKYGVLAPAFMLACTQSIVFVVCIWFTWTWWEKPDYKI